MPMVRLGPKPKKLDAAICRVLVMNGGDGLRFWLLCSIPETSY